jgi:hypothetical protein
MALPAPILGGVAVISITYWLLDPHGSTYHSLFQRLYEILPVRGVEHY